PLQVRIGDRRSVLVDELEWSANRGGSRTASAKVPGGIEEHPGENYQARQKGCENEDNMRRSRRHLLSTCLRSTRASRRGPSQKTQRYRSKPIGPVPQQPVRRRSRPPAKAAATRSCLIRSAAYTYLQ